MMKALAFIAAMKGPATKNIMIKYKNF